MQGKGKVLLVELVVTPNDKDATAVLIDLEMLHATHGGRERTESEFAQLFASSGLQLNRVVRTKSPFLVLEAVPALKGRSEGRRGKVIISSQTTVPVGPRFGLP